MTIVSSIVENRTTDYQNSGDFLPDTVNADFDRVVSLTKQQEDRSSRTLAFPESLQNATSLTLSLPQAGLYLAWKGDESGVENVGAPAVILPSELNGTTVQMVANATPVDGDYIVTSGYGANGDGGGNQFLTRPQTGGPYDGGSLIRSVGDPDFEFVGLFPGGETNLKQWGAPNGTDDSAAFEASRAYNNFVYLSDGDYIIDTIEIDTADFVLKTDDFRTLVTQKDEAGRFDQPIFRIAASNVTFGSMRMTGNIATDTVEHDHAISIEPGTATPSEIRNTTLGDYIFTDIRGDGIYIGGTVTTPVFDVKIGSVHGDNVYRSVVSVVGGEDIHIKSATGGMVGYTIVDVEPNLGGQGTDAVVVDYVKGGRVQCVSAGSAVFNKHVYFKHLILRQDLQPDSNPPYGFHGNDISIIFTNTEMLHIGVLDAKDIDRDVIHSEVSGVSSIKCNLVIDEFIFSNVSRIDVSFNTAIYAELCDSVVIHKVKGIAFSNLKALVRSEAASNTTVVVNGGSYEGGVLGTGLLRPHFSNFTVADADGAANALATCVGGMLTNCALDYTGSPIFDNCPGAATIGCDLTASSLETNSDEVVAFQTNIGAQRYTFYNAEVANWESPMRMGGGFIWSDASAVLRIKSTTPTSDTDGTIVGDQS